MVEKSKPAGSTPCELVLPRRRICGLPLSVQTLSWDGKGETEHNRVRLVSLGDGAAVKVLRGNLEQGSVAGYRTEIS